MVEYSTKKRKKTDWYGTVGLSLILTAIVLLIWFFINGKITVTGANPDAQRGVSLTCRAEGLKYPYFAYNNANNTLTTVNVVFDDSGSMRSISLIQNMYYSTEEESANSDVQNSVAMGLKMGQDGYYSDDFSVTFTHSNSITTMTIFADTSNFSAKSSKYFLLDYVTLKSNIDIFADEYEKQGFSCTKNE